MQQAGEADALAGRQEEEAAELEAGCARLQPQGAVQGGDGVVLEHACDAQRVQLRLDVRGQGQVGGEGLYDCLPPQGDAHQAQQGLEVEELDDGGQEFHR